MKIPIQPNTETEKNGLLPPANEVCKGNVFTGVCLSTGGVSVRVGGFCQGGDLSGRPPYGKEQVVRILLDCILVITVCRHS